MKRIFLFLCVALFLYGCASSSGVAKIGTDTFTITTSASPGRGGVPTAKRSAYEEAKAECNRRALNALVLNETLSPPTWTEGMAIVTLNFRCLNASDADFQMRRTDAATETNKR